jgi:hypothetical protein
MRKRKAKLNYRRIVLRLPDLDHSKMAVLNSLTSPGSRRVYQFAINQFITWYCSEPRLAFNRIVVVRYRMYLESRRLAANTINQQLAAVRRLAHEAADAGLLSPDLAAGISRVKGVKQLGQRSGNWLSLEQSSEVLRRARGDLMREKREYVNYQAAACRHAKTMAKRCADRFRAYPSAESCHQVCRPLPPKRQAPKCSQRLIWTSPCRVEVRVLFPSAMGLPMTGGAGLARIQ